MGGHDVSPDELYSQSAIYIAAAHALKPNYSVCSFCFLISYLEVFFFGIVTCGFTITGLH